MNPQDPAAPTRAAADLPVTGPPRRESGPDPLLDELHAVELERNPSFGADSDDYEYGPEDELGWVEDREGKIPWDRLAEEDAVLVIDHRSPR